MKTEITTEQAIGKTVKGFLLSKMSAQMIIYFEDETFTVFGITKDYDGDVNIIAERMDWFNFGYKKDLFQAGILSEQDWQTLCDEADRRDKQDTEQEERKQYERLKAKFD